MCKVLFYSNKLIHLMHKKNTMKWRVLKILQIRSPRHKNLRNFSRTSLVAQWLRIRLPMQGTWVRTLVREDPTCRGATKPVCHNYWACALLEPTCHNYWACAPRACAPQQEKPPQWEARAPQRRAAPARHN